MEFTDIVEISVVKTDLNYELSVVKALGVGSPEYFFKECFDLGILDHFSITWSVLAPLNSWRELDQLLSTQPVVLPGAPIFYLPDSDSLGELEIELRAHLEVSTESSLEHYKDMIQSGAPAYIADFVLPSNLMQRKLVTMSAGELVAAIRHKNDYSPEAEIIITGLSRVFRSCSPHIYQALENLHDVPLD